MRKFLTVNRVMYLLGALALCIAIVMNLTAQIPFVGFLPVVRWVDLAINCICGVCCIILFIRPNNKLLTYILFFVEGGITVHMGFIGIGTLLFAAGCIMVFINGDFQTRYKEKIICLVVYWVIIVIGLYFSFNIKVFLFEIALTFFYFGLTLNMYRKLEAKLSYLLPNNETVTTMLELPPRGSLLKLSDYGLSERQIAFIIGSVKEGKTYHELGNLYNVSTSVVKRDMAMACKCFGIKNREALKILLLQYTIE